jgi:hypothetical protein
MDGERSRCDSLLGCGWVDGMYRMNKTEERREKTTDARLFARFGIA